jgi:hypothetical protein
MDELTKGCLAILLWTAIFIGGLCIGCDVNKPIGIIIMVTDALVLYIKLRAQTEVQNSDRRRRRYEADAVRRWEEAMRDDK